MTDMTRNSDVGMFSTDKTKSDARLRARYAKNRRLQAYGIAAISIAIIMLGILLSSIFSTGYFALTQTHVSFDVALPESQIDPEDVRDADWDEIVESQFLALLPGIDEADRASAVRILSGGAVPAIRAAVENDPSLIGQTITFSVPVSDPYDQLQKGLFARDTSEEFRRVNDLGIQWFDTLDEAGAISTPLNWGLLTNPNSRFPELAGLRGALIGSVYALSICFLLSFPIGIAAAVYLEEYAPKNRLTDFIEVNINNLAAVPSIIYGLLGLAVFIGFLGFPRSVPLVGGMVLALMTLPTIIIATRAALKAVPPSIREAAFGVGASRLQVVTHHVVPLAMPGIMTGTIIGMAAALGETAPLLLIGMNAFLTAVPEGMLSASTVLPTEIYIWADSPERGFTTRTSAAILVLLTFMFVMNGIAIYLRRRLETRW